LIAQDAPRLNGVSQTLNSRDPEAANRRKTNSASSIPLKTKAAKAEGKAKNVKIVAAGHKERNELFIRGKKVQL
jgi:hypothetical protein